MGRRVHASLPKAKGTMTEATKPLGPDTPLYNSRVILNYVDFARRRCAGVNIDEALAYAGIAAHQLEDEDHWFTQAQEDLFHEKLVELTGNRDIAGRQADMPRLRHPWGS